MARNASSPTTRIVRPKSPALRPMPRRSAGACGQGLERADFARKRELLELLIDRIVVTDETVEIRYVIPVGPEGERDPFCLLRTDYQGLLDAPAERDRDEARALPRARGDGEDRAVPGGIAGDVLARVAAGADPPPQAPAGRVGAREQRIGAVLVVHAGGGHHGDE